MNECTVGGCIVNDDDTEGRLPVFKCGCSVLVC